MYWLICQRSLTRLGRRYSGGLKPVLDDDLGMEASPEGEQEVGPENGQEG